MITLIWPGSLLPLMCMDLAKMALEDPIPLRHGHAMLQCLGCLGSMSGLRGAVSYWHPQVEVTRHLFHPYADQGGPSADYEEWLFSRMRSKGSRFTLGVWGLRVCSLDVAFTSATVRNRSQPSAGVRAIPVWPCLWEVLQRWSFLGVADVSLLRFAWQAWHFVTFRRVLERVESRLAWQAQYFCDVFRICVAVFVAGAALWTCPSSFFVAGAAL